MKYSNSLFSYTRELYEFHVQFQFKIKLFFNYNLSFIVMIIIRLLMPHRWATGLRYGLYIRRTGHNQPRGSSADWWMPTAANAAGTNGLTCLPKHGGSRDSKFLVTHLMTDQRCLTLAIARGSALNATPAAPSSYSLR
jgi:hypothetical protein